MFAKLMAALNGTAGRQTEQRLAELEAVLQAVDKTQARIDAGRQAVIGVNKYVETEPSPLTAGEGDILTVDPAVEADQIERLMAWRGARDSAACEAALTNLRAAAQEGRNVMPASIEAAKAGVTTGEWGQVMREVFGEYRAPTGVGKAAAAPTDGLEAIRSDVEAVSNRLGRRIKFLVGKPGLDGHSNGAEQIAVRARDCGMEVVYEGIRLTPAQIVNAALEESVHVVGLSILSGSHMELMEDILTQMRAAGIGDIPVVVGGIIPDEDAAALRAKGVARVYTPKDFELNRIMADIISIVGEATREAA